MKPFIHPLALVESQDIGDDTKIWAFAHVMAGARIGVDCNVGDHAFLGPTLMLINERMSKES